jgi:hypothetical protein
VNDSSHLYVISRNIYGYRSDMKGREETALIWAGRGLTVKITEHNEMKERGLTCK